MCAPLQSLSGWTARPLFLLAQLKQDDVLKSISDNVSQSGDGTGKTFLAILLGVVAIIILAVIYNSRTKRPTVSKSTNHPGKLLRELTRQIPLRPAEMKQLKLLAQGERDAGKSVENPLVFILCPSAFANAARAQRVKMDKKVIASLAKKLGLLTATPKAKR